MSKVKKGDKVKVHYTGKLKDGTIFDTSVEREPLEFEVGSGRLIPGFENGVIGMEPEDKKTVEIDAANAYGDVREDLILEIQNNQLPSDLNPKVGMELISQQPDGQQINVTVKEVKNDAIVIDANHKLAGKDLIFEIELLEID
ncbi:MAG: peptidylprolyl isomerase [Bacteroidales bacterium]|nr:peptidylprolyl isomerase [Bacteroidales bacterium]